MAVVGGRLAPRGPYLVIDPVRLAAYCRTPGGPILRDLERRGTNVQTGAKARVGKQTRLLERSIVKRTGVDGDGPFCLVASEGVPYALMHHEGTAPHLIRPRNRKVLRFPAPGSTPGNVGVVFARMVHHPGTAPNRYLRDSLPLAAH